MGGWREVGGAVDVVPYMLVAMVRAIAPGVGVW